MSLQPLLVPPARGEPAELARGRPRAGQPGAPPGLRRAGRSSRARSPNNRPGPHTRKATNRQAAKRAAAKRPAAAHVRRRTPGRTGAGGGTGCPGELHHRRLDRDGNERELDREETASGTASAGTGSSAVEPTQPAGGQGEAAAGAQGAALAATAGTATGAQASAAAGPCRICRRDEPRGRERRRCDDCVLTPGRAAGAPEQGEAAPPRVGATATAGGSRGTVRARARPRARRSRHVRDHTGTRGNRERPPGEARAHPRRRDPRPTPAAPRLRTVSRCGGGARFERASAGGRTARRGVRERPRDRCRGERRSPRRCAARPSSSRRRPRRRRPRAAPGPSIRRGGSRRRKPPGPQTGSVSLSRAAVARTRAIAGASPAGAAAAMSSTAAGRSGSAARRLAATALEGVEAAAPAGAGQGPVLAAGVPMQNTIDAIRATIEIAARQGLTQARIALQPEELGEISIHLSQSAAGLIARVTADTPAAAQALAQGRAELHQSLSSLGVSLLRLDIGSSGQPRAGEREEGPAGDSRGRARATEPEDVEGERQRGARRAPRRASARAALVDVLA